MPRIEVLPEQLHGAGTRQATLAGELRGLGGRLVGIGASAADGAGDARAGSAIMDCCQGWSNALIALADAVDGYGANLTAAGSAYRETDAATMPTTRGDR